jgi:hypothetical protein
MKLLIMQLGNGNMNKKYKKLKLGGGQACDL